MIYFRIGLKQKALLFSKGLNIDQQVRQVLDDVDEAHFMSEAQVDQLVTITK